MHHFDVDCLLLFLGGRGVGLVCRINPGPVSTAVAG